MRSVGETNDASSPFTRHVFVALLLYHDAHAVVVEDGRFWFQWVPVGFLSAICLPGQHPKTPGASSNMEHHVDFLMLK